MKEKMRQILAFMWRGLNPPPRDPDIMGPCRPSTIEEEVMFPIIVVGLCLAIFLLQYLLCCLW